MPQNFAVVFLLLAIREKVENTRLDVETKKILILVSSDDRTDLMMELIIQGSAKICPRSRLLPFLWCGRVIDENEDTSNGD